MLLGDGCLLWFLCMLLGMLVSMLLGMLVCMLLGMLVCNFMYACMLGV